MCTIAVVHSNNFLIAEGRREKIDDPGEIKVSTANDERFRQRLSNAERRAELCGGLLRVVCRMQLNVECQVTRPTEMASNLVKLSRELYFIPPETVVPTSSATRRLLISKRDIIHRSKNQFAA
jgi:hypothetical protein